MTPKTSRQTESVWDYPRPPRIDHDDRRVEVAADGGLIAATCRSIRLLETSHPPVFYINPDDVDLNVLAPSPKTTFCEFKGMAVYWDVIGVMGRVRQVAWSYPNPTEGYEEIAGWLAFHPSEVDCTVDGEIVRPQAGGFYGGWITSEIIGPFKGGLGTAGW